jgi:hypothetical protein
LSATSSFHIGVTRGRHQAGCWREFRSGTSGTNHLFANSARSPPECIVMKVGNWIILAVLLGMLSGTIWIGCDIWKTTADVPISENGYVAMGVGAALSLLIGCGLMALLFYSSRHGYDEPPHEDNRLHRK